MNALPTARCEGVRARAALAPDGELAQLERRLLDAHLAHCEDCRRFAAGVAAIASGLRQATVARPERSVAPVLHRPRLLPVRAATAAAAVASIAFGIAGQPPTRADLRTASVAAPSAAEEQQAFRQHRRTELLTSAAAAERALQAFGDRPA